MDTIEDSDTSKHVFSQNLTSQLITSDHLKTSHVMQFASPGLEFAPFVSQDQLMDDKP